MMGTVAHGLGTGSGLQVCTNRPVERELGGAALFCQNHLSLKTQSSGTKKNLFIHYLSQLVVFVIHKGF
jgi:hypothetical protein